MKYAYFIKACAIFLLVNVSACIKDEAPNAEADIEYLLIKNDSILVNKADTLVKIGTESNQIIIKVLPGSDLRALSPTFILTKGAVVSPASGTVLDFSDNKEHAYTVTSEDGKWTKTYTLQFRDPKINTAYSFENAELTPPQNKFYSFYELLADGTKDNLWASGNAGFMLSQYSALPEEYPTVPYASGKTGFCAKLETRSTGSLGAMVNKRIAAGNLFIGSFQVEAALTNPLTGTRFGVPFNYQPISLKGWYKYTPGSVLQDRDGNPIIGQTDICDIYAVFYENTQQLDGSNILSSPLVVAVARMTNATACSEWTYFELPFVYQKQVDNDKLNNYQYNLTVVFSSSKNGGQFIGAIGSVLLIDEVEVTY